MDNKSAKNSSLFENFLNEIDNEQLLQCDILNDEKSITEICESDKMDSTVNINVQHNNLNDYNYCNDMVIYFI